MKNDPWIAENAKQKKWGVSSLQMELYAPILAFKSNNFQRFTRRNAMRTSHSKFRTSQCVAANSSETTEGTKSHSFYKVRLKFIKN